MPLKYDCFNINSLFGITAWWSADLSKTNTGELNKNKPDGFSIVNIKYLLNFVQLLEKKI